ncbi:MAG: MerR family DNA-binding protein, partial [Sphingobium sp.]|nr:MerR family DNA-binding protein [Sphingobium sp.]
DRKALNSVARCRVPSGRINRLRFIRRARDLGFTLDQVRALLDLASQPSRDCGSVDELTSGHLAMIDRKLADLAALRRELAALLTSCRGGTVSECRILEAFGPAPTEAKLPTAEQA